MNLFGIDILRSAMPVIRMKCKTKITPINQVKNNNKKIDKN
jgi:hypothetical protein